MIKKIKVKNFKSIRELTLDLPQFLAVIGINAAGKTNLIQAIKFTQKLALGFDINNVSRELAMDSEELFNYNENCREFDMSMNIETQGEENYKYTFNIVLKDKEHSSKLIISYEKLEKVKGEKIIKIFERRDDNLENEEGENIPLSLSSDISALSMYKNDEVFNAKKVFSNLFVFDEDVIDSKEPLTKFKDGESLASLLIGLKNENEKNYSVFTEIASKIIPNFSSCIEIDTGKNKKSDNDERYVMMLMQEKNLKSKLSPKCISSGDLKTLFILAKAISLKEGSTLILEEIENGIHPNRLTLLKDNLETLAVKKDIQIIFTTHSPSLINELKPADIVFVYKNKTGTNFKLLEGSKEISSIQDFLNKGGQLDEYINVKFS